MSESRPTYADNSNFLPLALTGDDDALSCLIEANMPLVQSIARKFCGRGTELEDLIQIGTIGLLRAVRTYDMDRGTALSTYAVPLIIGEIRRFLRDDGPIKIGRTRKSTAAMLLRKKEEFLKEHGREPGITELSELCGLEVSEAVAALEAASPLRSLYDPIGDEGELTLGDTVTGEDTVERTVELIALKESLSRLPALWRQIVVLRYYKNYTQKETAAALGLTQVKISREEKKIFESLRRELAV